jgi:anti-sigma B factor antagonist
MGAMIENLQTAALHRRWGWGTASSGERPVQSWPYAQPPLRIDVVEDGEDCVRAIVGGEIDGANAAMLQARITAMCAAAGTRRLILDVGAVEFMDSSALRALLEIQGALGRAHGEMVLLAPCAQVRGLLAMTGLDRRLRSAGTLEQARAAVRGRARNAG